MRFREKIRSLQQEPLTASGIDLLQVSLGYRCNMACRHCHVQGAPDRTEVMDRKHIDAVLAVLETGAVPVLDITGGAPELNPHFRYLVQEAKKRGCHLIVRNNLTIFFEPGMEDLYDFYNGHDIEITASLPYFQEEGVDRVRGRGTFRRSIKALQMLNRMGYGTVGPGKSLNLVYNPRGAFLPPSQAALETEYRKALHEEFGISFNRLYAFANMPIGRFLQFLERSGNRDKYIEKLSAAFNPETLPGLMCRHLVNVGWDGRLYDCDFNQIAGLGIAEGCPGHIRDFDIDMLSSRKISLDDHCFACTAGQGST